MAFIYRTDGMTYEQIGEKMNYDPSAVEKALQRTLGKPPRRPRIKYPRLAAYMEETQYGSIEAWATDMRTSPHRLRRVLVWGDPPSETLVQKITKATGLSREEAFFCTDAKSAAKNSTSQK